MLSWHLADQCREEVQTSHYWIKSAVVSLRWWGADQQPPVHLLRSRVMDCVIPYGRPEAERAAVRFLFSFSCLHVSFWSVLAPDLCQIPSVSASNSVHVPNTSGVTPLKYKTTYFKKKKKKTFTLEFISIWRALHLNNVEPGTENRGF